MIAIGGFSPEHPNDPLHRFVVDAAKKPKPRICFVGLASGDLDLYRELFYEQYPSTVCMPTHLELLREVKREPAGVLASQDIVLVGGGSTPILVAGLRILGLDAVLRDVIERGGVVCGWSAGAHAAFRGCITDSLGPELRVFPDGLGIIDGSCIAHADAERDAMLRSAMTSGRLPSPAWAIEDGAAVAFSGDAVHAVSWHPGAAASFLRLRDSGVRATSLETTQL